MKIGNWAALTSVMAALAGCAGTPEAAPPGKEEAASCVAYLTLERDAVRAGKAHGSLQALDLAAASWRAQGQQRMSAEGFSAAASAQVTALKSTPADKLEAEASACEKSAPARL